MFDGQRERQRKRVVGLLPVPGEVVEIGLMASRAAPVDVQRVDTSTPPKRERTRQELRNCVKKEFVHTKVVLKELAVQLDAWIALQNLEADEQGLPRLKPCRIRVLGQTALLEAGAPLQLNVTNDVDVYADYAHAIQVEFQRLLATRGKELDPSGHEVWMPRETRYGNLFVGSYVTLQLADVDAVLVSKALKAPEKNRALIIEYLAAGATERFLAMATKYHLDLEQFL